VWFVTGVISPSGTNVVINLKANVKVNTDSKNKVIKNGLISGS